MTVVVTMLTYIIVLARRIMLFSYTLSGDDEAEIAFEESKELVDCQCRPVSRSCISPKKDFCT